MSKKKKSSDIHLDKASLQAAAGKLLASLSRYAGILFFVLIAIIYGFVIMRINLLSNAQPSQGDIDAQSVSTPLPQVDPKVAAQLQQLEDNSVNVQTLFNDARNNPF